MKLLLVVVLIGVVQVCFGASITKCEIESSNEEEDDSDEDFDYIREIFESIPGMDDKTIDEISNNFKKFEKISADTENLELYSYLLSLLINADFAKVYRAVFTYRLALIEDQIFNVKNSIESESESEHDESTSSEEILVDDLDKLEYEFSKELTPWQTASAMRIIKGFGYENADGDEFYARLDRFTKRIYDTNELFIFDK